MSDDAWFRNVTWNSDVEGRFEQRLRRARNKSEYLRIQAHSLREAHPEITLWLIERYFALNVPYSPAPVLETKAEALANLGRIEEAIDTYEQVLACEAVRPTTQTNAFAGMAELVVLHDLKQHYDRIIEVLDSHVDRPLLPVLRFVHHACKAIIHHRRQQPKAARSEAQLALTEASRRHSGLPYHPTIGLVSDRESKLLELLGPCCDA